MDGRNKIMMIVKMAHLASFSSEMEFLYQIQGHHAHLFSAQ
ncbi:hypothetical protein B4096_1438 [Heyndrickxia coagulans]|uniref:Uncharacterized protein n=1 Tax=Heyndrickxia coagulans TaxID=1398 RepID=A0A133KQS4_HEYCO|nr:hypothetical protein HMPREF3213_01890 [Heyndrickxia coagulans]KYC89128.1 hypothetical protein B4096_1438 [Heyndrickxia coagulans]